MKQEKAKPNEKLQERDRGVTGKRKLNPEIRWGLRLRKFSSKIPEIDLPRISTLASQLQTLN